MITQSYIVKNDRQFGAALDKAAEQVGDLRVAFGLIQKDWHKSNKAQFQLKGSGQYPALSESYAQQKRRKYPGSSILVRTGKLRDSMTSKNSDAIVKVGKQSMILGTRVAYGIFHQSDAPRKKIPLRKFLFIGPEAPSTAPRAITGRVERWLAILEAEVQRQLRKTT